VRQTKKSTERWRATNETRLFHIGVRVISRFKHKTVAIRSAEGDSLSSALFSQSKPVMVRIPLNPAQDNTLLLNSGPIEFVFLAAMQTTHGFGWVRIVRAAPASGPAFPYRRPRRRFGCRGR